MSSLHEKMHDQDLKCTRSLRAGRVSALASPTILLAGHKSEVLTMRFSPDGMCCASGSADRCILLWKVFSPTCDNYMLLRGHRGAVLEVHWMQDGHNLISCSSDHSIRAWDAEAGTPVKLMKEHEAFVNSCSPLQTGPPLIVSGADDGLIKVWDLRVKRSTQTLHDKYPVTAVSFSREGAAIYTGSIDNTIKIYDIRQCLDPLTLSGHNDTITGLRISPDGTHLLSNAMDNTARIWDVRSMVVQKHCTKILTGHMHSFTKNLLKCDWSPDASRVSAGSEDRIVYVWDVASRQVIYKLTGHTGSVNEVVFHPSEKILGSCSSDKLIYIGDLS